MQRQVEVSLREIIAQQAVEIAQLQQQLSNCQFAGQQLGSQAFTDLSRLIEGIEAAGGLQVMSDAEVARYCGSIKALLLKINSMARPFKGVKSGINEW